MRATSCVRRSVVENANLRFGSAMIFALFDGQVLTGEGCDLRQVRHAENLLASRESFELLPNGFGRAPADTDVDFVENERTRRRVLLP